MSSGEQGTNQWAETVICELFMKRKIIPNLSPGLFSSRSVAEMLIRFRTAHSSVSPVSVSHFARFQQLHPDFWWNKMLNTRKTKYQNFLTCRSFDTRQNRVRKVAKLTNTNVSHEELHWDQLTLIDFAYLYSFLSLPCSNLPGPLLSIISLPADRPGARGEGVCGYWSIRIFQWR